MPTLPAIGSPQPDVKLVFFFQAEDGIRDVTVTGVQTWALPIFTRNPGGTGNPAFINAPKLAPFPPARAMSSLVISDNPRTNNRTFSVLCTTLFIFFNLPIPIEYIITKFH